MTEDLQKIESHLKELDMPERIDFDNSAYTLNPKGFFEVHFDYLRGAGSEEFKKPYEDRIRLAYKAVLDYNKLN